MNFNFYLKTYKSNDSIKNNNINHLFHTFYDIWIFSKRIIVKKRLKNALKEPEKVYKLDLSGQQIGDLPESIGDLKNLHRLTISNNRIKLIPESIKSLTNLRALDLENNRLTKSTQKIIKSYLPNCTIEFK